MKFVEELLAVLAKHNAYIRSDCQTGCDLIIVVDEKEIGTLEHTDWASGPVRSYVISSLAFGPRYFTAKLAPASPPTASDARRRGRLTD